MFSRSFASKKCEKVSFYGFDLSKSSIFAKSRFQYFLAIHFFGFSFYAFHSCIALVTMADRTMNDDETQDHDMELSNNAATIDGSGGSSSRILQSASIQKEEQRMDVDDPQQPQFAPVSAHQANGSRSEYRRVRCPPHRYTPLRDHWEQILTPLVEYLKLQVGF
jgi:hypothetical protein